MHMFAAFYFVIVLSIENQWVLSYDELIKLKQIVKGTLKPRTDGSVTCSAHANAIKGIVSKII